MLCCRMKGRATIASIWAVNEHIEVTIESEAPLSESLVRECIRSIGETGYPTGAASSEEVKQGLLARLFGG